MKKIIMSFVMLAAVGYGSQAFAQDVKDNKTCHKTCVDQKRQHGDCHKQSNCYNGKTANCANQSTANACKGNASCNNAGAACKPCNAQCTACKDCGCATGKCDTKNCKCAKCPAKAKEVNKK